ncbi:MAG: hypothetical protein ABIH18_05805 [Candidatus Omnitrophota bacterium]
MKKKILILLCLWLLIGGCATVSNSNPNQKDSTGEKIFPLQEILDQKDIEIQNLNNIIKEKDAKIEELKHKLSTFGVFE